MVLDKYKGWIKVEDMQNINEYPLYIDYEDYLKKTKYYESYKEREKDYQRHLKDTSEEQARKRFAESIASLDALTQKNLDRLIENRQFKYVYIHPSKYPAYEEAYARKYPRSEIGKRYRQKIAGLFIV